MKLLVNPFKSSLLLIALVFLTACNGGGGGGGNSQQSDNSVAKTDNRPVANAGIDQTVSEGQLVTLNGSESYDPEGSTLIFHWRLISGSAITLSSESEDTPSFIAPSNGQTLTFQLVVEDENNNISIADTVTVTTAVISSGDNSGNNNGNPNDNNTDGSGGDDTTGDSGSGDNNSGDNNSGDNGSGDGNNTGGDDTSGNNNNPPDDNTNNDQTDPVINNTRPVANAGQDRTVNGFSLVILDGSLSTDLENDTLTYLWQQTSGTSVTLNNPGIVAPNFDAPNTNETLTFSLTVSDSELNSEIDEVSISIVQVNTAPTANAGQDKTVTGLSQVILQGSLSSDPEGDNLSYEWQQISGPTITLHNAQAANPSFDAPNLDANLTFSLVVSDGEFSSSADHIEVTIQAINNAPTANAGADQIAQGLSEIHLDGSLSSDPENSDLTYTWAQISGTTITLNNADTASPSFTALNHDEIIVFSLIVNDGELNSELDTVAITIEKTNTIPVAHAGVDRYVGSLSVVALNGTLSNDADNDPITFTWTQLSGPSVILNDKHAIKPIFTADTDGQLVFSLTVNDGENDSEADTVKVVVGPIPATNIKVNGTGITWGGNFPSGNNTVCIGEAIEQQDCSLGRELTHNDDSDGRVGFSFTKYDSNGVEVGHDASEWQCVQDSVTGLMWEIKTGGNSIIGDEGINDADDRYSWHNSDPASNGGGPGFTDNQGEVCSDYDSENPETYCNTQAFVERMNKNAWCGFADWRIPTRKELLSIVDYGNSRPMIDSDYFPEVGQFIWTSTPLALGSISAWGVNFNYGNSFSIDKRNARQVRLVRGGYE
jgi:hypothetical protein